MTLYLECVKVCQINATFLGVEWIPPEVEGAVEPLLVLALVNQGVLTPTVEEHTSAPIFFL